MSVTLLEWPPVLAGLLETTVRAAALLVLAGGAALLLRRASAALRHLAWTVALAGVLVLPLASALSPFQWDVLPGSWAAMDARSATAEAAAAPPAVRPATPAAEAGPRAIAKQVGTAPPPAGSPLTWPTALLLLWAAGAGALGTFFAYAALRLRRLRLGSVEAPAAWSALADAAARRMGIRTPAVRVSAEVDIPITLGPARTVVLLPAEAREWPAERLAAALQHEFAHVARHDLGTQLVAAAACTLHWFNPLVWVAARQARLEAERACDDVVVASGALPSSYARHLLETALAARPAMHRGLALSMARPSELEGRIRALLAPHRRGMPAGPLGGAVVASAALVLVLLVASAAGSSGPPTGTDAAAQATLLEAADTEGGAAIHSQARVSVLLALVRDADPHVRGAAARSLAGADPERALPALLLALADEHRDVREDAARAVGSMGAEAAVADLAARAAGDPSRSVRYTAIWALGEIGSDEAVGSLVTLLDDAHRDNVRERVADALGDTRNPAAFEALQELASDQDRGVRYAALEALARLGSPEALAALSEALETADSHTRRRLARALGNAR
ncbi:MAG: M56 family metallopeptidase [Gemmatimonadota bacterium]